MSSPAARDTIGRRELLFGTPAAPSPHWLRVSRPAMACRFEVTLSGEDARWVAAAQQALAEAVRLEAQLSVFRDTSELSGLNRRAAEAGVHVTGELFDLLTLCSRLHRDTNGAFDVTSTPLSRCWGFLARQGRIPAVEAIDAARALVGMDAVVLDEAQCTVRFVRPGLEINLGSIGKGYAVGRIGAALKAAGVRHALVSAAGSSVLALGGRGGGWEVDVTSRAAGPAPIARLRLRNAALATSGVGEQWVASAEVSGSGVARRYGHVIDPRTGWPAQGILCASVVTSDAASADALATAFLVGGEALARACCAAQPDVLALLYPEGADRPIVIGSHPGVKVEES